jgi:hypothetical protein
MTPFDKRKIITFFVIIIAILLVFITGCSDKTIDTTVNVNIDQTGNISKYTLTTTMSDAQYLNIKKAAASQGYSSVREYFLRDFSGSSDYFEYNEPDINSGKKIELVSVKTIDSDHTLKSIILRNQNNQLYFNDSTFSSDYFFPRAYVKKMEYTLESKIKIKNHNANSQSMDHYSITWSFKEDQNIPTLYLISEPISSNTVKTPGFEAVFSILSLSVIGYVFRKKFRNEEST